ncbi:hypothetical protein HPP92_014098 [Vanilla planifolia]|uniref:DYW domain-containing protein n=1 Tax=Vanilla planifolia TaxID=51239 RepID=A0A835QZ04_VANPL|nr:hypothetical protein HPP92_014098 [Vanilla planifolia]
MPYLAKWKKPGGFPVESLALYREMLFFDRKADNFTYPFVLMACGDLFLQDVGETVHCQVIVCGYEMNVYVGNSLMSMYSKFGKVETVQKVFDRMLTRDVTSFNTIMSSYVHDGQQKKALNIFSVMALGGMRLDQTSFLIVLSACSDLAALCKGKELHAHILRVGFQLNQILSNAFIDVYMNSYFVVGARRIFETMCARDIVSWNSMIFGFSRYGNALESLFLFHQMTLHGMSPDLVTFLAVLGACGQIAALQIGRVLHAYISKLGLGYEVSLGTALIDMYAKCGCLPESLQIFNEMPIKNIFSWSAMLSGYGIHGRGEEAVSFFNQMNGKGIKPDKVTFTSLLSACSHAGLVDIGREIFLQMQRKHTIIPHVVHYICMVDLLGRSGHLDEAYKLILDMKVTPNVDVWNALLSACQIHHNVELAEIAAQNVIHLLPQGFGVYASLSNIYAKEKRWGDVERVRTLARQNGLRKPPGCSYVELDLTIHRFLVGDKSHPQSKVIYAKMEELKQKLKEVGYVPDTRSVFYEVEDGLKEDILWDHSERLAIAFALINTSPGAIIRVTKNLRVCCDCHEVIKLISKLVEREIILRDARRFHHFQSGSCSCGDFWGSLLSRTFRLHLEVVSVVRLQSLRSQELKLRG